LVFVVVRRCVLLQNRIGAMLAFRSRGHGVVRSPVNDKGPVIFSARSARSVLPTSLRHVLHQAECHRAEHCDGHPMCRRCATARPPSLPRRRNLSSFNCEPDCAIRCTGRTPPVGIVQNAGSAKPRTPGSSVGGSQTFAEDLGCLVKSVERTAAGYALIPRIGSRDPSRRHRWTPQSGRLGS
jgi:hypothetical protein